MDEYIKFRPDALPPPAGYINSGSICWFNSIFQALLSCTPLGDVLTRDAPLMTANPFATALVRAYGAARDGNAGPGDSGNVLAAFLQRIQAKKVDTAIGRRQECTDEAFTLIIDMLGSEPVRNLFYSSYQIDITCSICGEIGHMPRDLAYRIDCPERINATTPAEFTKYLKTHTSITSGFTCKNNHRPACATRVEKLRAVREIIVLTFGKFFGKYEQYYPDAFEIPRMGGGVLRYELVATVEHFGGQSGGHYLARCRRRGGHIFALNDQSVSPADFTPQASTYMVFYCLV